MKKAPQWLSAALLVAVAGLPAGAAVVPLGAQAAGVHFAAQQVQSKSNAPAIDRLYAALARAQNAAAAGNMPLAHTQLARAQATAQGIGGRYSALGSDLTALRRREVLTVSDLQGVLGKLGSQEQPGAESGFLSFGAQVSRQLGVTQLPLRGILALLALYPLALLRQVARGKYWWGLWLGLTLLLVPTLLGGVLALLGGLGARLHWGALSTLLALPAWQSAWGWLPEQLCVLAALGILGYNLWHIGIQFGVVGKPKKAATLTEIQSNSPWELD